MTLNTEGELWEKDRIMECTRDEREDYLGAPNKNVGKCGRGQEKCLALFNISNDVV